MSHGAQPICLFLSRLVGGMNNALPDTLLISIDCKGKNINTYVLMSRSKFIGKIIDDFGLCFQ